MKKSKITIITLLSIVSMNLFSCNNSENTPSSEQTETHRSGNVNMYIDESFKLLFDTSIETFESQNPNANVEAIYSSETEALKSLLNRNTNSIIITRDLNEKELETIKNMQSQMKRDKLGEDAVVLIINKENVDSTMSVDYVKEILLGEVKQWKTSKADISVVFDNNGSANYYYMKKLINDREFTKNVYAVKSNTQVIEHVKNNKNAIGVIGLNWISDLDNNQSLENHKDIKVVSLSAFGDENYFKPYQGYIYTREYPLVREIWSINKYNRKGLNTGFINFMLGEKGQLIMQRANLVPGKTPVRLIQIQN